MRVSTGEAPSSCPARAMHADRQSVILVNPGVDLDELKQTIEKLSASSPNAVEFMHKYKSKEATESVKEIRVKWASEGRDKQLFPRETVLTEENCEPVLRMMAIGVGKDVFDIKMQSKKVEGSE